MRTGGIVDRVGNLLMADSSLIPMVGERPRQCAEPVGSRRSVLITQSEPISLKESGVVGQDRKD